MWIGTTLAHPSTSTHTQVLFAHSFNFKTSSTVSASPPCCRYGQRNKHNHHKHGIEDKYQYLLRNFHSNSKWTSSSVYCSLNPAGASESENQHQRSDYSEIEQMNKGFWSKWKANSAEMSSKLAKLGLAAVLAYGLFDGITYTTFFVLAFFGYEKSTGKNPAANLQALLGIVILMWTGNNITRPFRVAGAAALAPFIDGWLKKIQDHCNFPSLVYAFVLVVSIVVAVCLTVVGLLILSRFGK